MKTLVHDAVCGMDLPENRIFMTEYVGGVPYAFCSAQCLAEFPIDVRKNQLTIVGYLFAWFLAACAGKEEQAKTADAVPPGDATSAVTAEPLKVVDHKTSGDYVVTLLNETGAISEGANRFTLEFRQGSAPDEQPIAVENLHVELSFELEGMAPMMGATSVVPAHDMTGPYNVASSRSAMPGLWKLIVAFDPGQQVEFTSTIHKR